MKTLEEAQEIILGQVKTLPAEQCDLENALSRYLTEEFCAPYDIPGFNNSAMDGYGILENDLKVGQRLKVERHIAAGDGYPDSPLSSGQCYSIMTGAVVPPEISAVVQREHVEGDTTEHITLKKIPSPGGNIRLAGEDFKKGQQVDLRGEPLAPGDIGVLASLGQTQLKVRRKPRVAIFTTGEELIDPGTAPGPGQVVNSNAWSLSAAVSQIGGECLHVSTAGDTLEKTIEAFRQCEGADIILSTGGVSVGDHDYVKDAYDALGVTTQFWKVKIKPGKPLVFATWGDRLLFGLPGNPVSCLVNYEMFVRPALLKMQGARYFQPVSFNVIVQEDFEGAGDRVHLVRALISYQDGSFLASRTGPQGSGLLHSMSRANALVRVDAPLKAGDQAVAYSITGKPLWR